VLVDAGEHIGEPGLGIDVIEARRLDQRVHESGALAAAIGAREQPGLAAECDPAQGALRGVVVRQIRPSSRKRVKGAQRFSM
jgi:hypothetical protein